MAALATDSDTQSVKTIEKTMQDATHEENADGERSPSLPTGNPINAFLIYTCTTFAAASLLFGFDDKVISPIVALQPFVCCARKHPDFVSFTDLRRSTIIKGSTHTLIRSSLRPEIRTFFSRYLWSDLFSEPFSPTH